MIEAIVFNAISGLVSEEKGIKTSDLLKISKMKEDELFKKNESVSLEIEWLENDMNRNLKVQDEIRKVITNQDFMRSYALDVIQGEYKRLENRYYKNLRLKTIYELALKVRQDERTK